MCDHGRLQYRFVNEGRVRVPTVRRNGTAAALSMEDALDEAAKRLGVVARQGGGAALAAIVSPHLTNEELFVLGRLNAGGLRTVQRDVAIRLGAADDFLIKAEKAANGRGARDLGLAAGPGELDLAGIRSAIEAGTIRGLLVTGTDVWDLWAESAELFRRLETLVVVSANEHPLLASADVVLPGLTFAEKDGTFTNHAGRVQRIWRALDPGEQPSDGEIFLALGRRLGMEIPPGPFDPPAVLREIARTVSPYRDVTWDALGGAGIPTAEA
jgi:predicted molibdopterin-dependent oxidoreductase YjgC